MENNYDKILNIKTSGRIDSHADIHHHPYEGTPYEVLERLIESGYIDEDNVVVDYGCGKGRVGFFLHSKLSCKCIGIEYNKDLYLSAMDNLNSYSEVSKGNNSNLPSFEFMSAEDYLPDEGDVFYFFNPFDSKILSTVLAKIEKSFYEDYRQIYLMFYYPDDEYIGMLMSDPTIMFVDEIDCSDLFGGTDRRERILIFELG